jgi:branched-chain amino acid transport system ATP-binding protein
MIEARGVSVRIGEIEILHGIDLDVPRGSIATVVGANGAGKTTLLRVLSRLLPLRAGTIRFDGQAIDAVPPHRLAQQGLVQVPQGRQIIPGLSVEDNLLIGARRVPDLDEAETARLLEGEYERFPVLRERRVVAGGSLSGGEQQMLALSRALMMRPKLLMLDEPSLGLAPQIVRAILSALQDLSRAGMTVLLVEQAAFTALKIADLGYVLQNGRVVLSGSSADLLKDQRLIERYLG